MTKKPDLFVATSVGTASLALVGGGGGHVKDSLALVVKDKAGDLAAGIGWKLGIELGWNNGSDYDYTYRFKVATLTAPQAEGGNGTVVTQEEFSLTAGSGGDGNDWFRVNSDSKSKSITDTTSGNWTWYGENESTAHEKFKQESDSSSEFSLRLSQSTGGEVSGSVVQSFEGGNTDETHVHNKHESKWQSTYDDGGGRVEIYKGKTPDKFDLDEVFTASYNGDGRVTLAADGSVTSDGSSHDEEHYTFDLVTVDEREYSTETTLTTKNSGGGTNIDW